MTTANSAVARFLAERIEASGQLQKDIAEKVGFEKPNMITMVKQGKTRLPLDKVGPMAKALEVDPLQLLQLCMQEYYPHTWSSIAQLLTPAITEDERQLLAALRASVGGPFLSALSDESRAQFQRLMLSLRAPAAIQ